MANEWKDIDLIVTNIACIKKTRKAGQWARYLIADMAVCNRIKDFLRKHHPENQDTFCDLKILQSSFIEGWEIR